MNHQSLKQYIELYHLGGIADFFIDNSTPQKTMSIQKEFIEVDAFRFLIEKYKDCTRCEYHKSNKRIIHGFGKPKVNCMIIGLPPTYDEIKIGKPFHFILELGEMFRKIFKEIQIKKDDYYVTNIIKCKANNYEMSEVCKCLPYIHEQFEIVKPKILLIFGVFAANAFLGKQEKIEYYQQNQGLDFKGVPVYVTYNPSELKDDARLKKPAWGDLQKFRDRYLKLVIEN